MRRLQSAWLCRRGKRRADLMFQYLACIVLRQRVPEDDLLGILEFGDALRVEKRAQAGDIGPGRAARYDHRTRPLAGANIGQTDDGDFRNVGMADQNVLDLLGGYVLAVANDDVLRSTGHHEIAAIHPSSELAGAEITFRIERLHL